MVQSCLARALFVSSQCESYIYPFSEAGPKLTSNPHIRPFHIFLHLIGLQVYHKLSIIVTPILKFCEKGLLNVK